MTQDFYTINSLKTQCGINQNISMDIPHHHHPAARLFIITLAGGAGVLCIALVIYLALTKIMAPNSAPQNNTNQAQAATNTASLAEDTALPEVPTNTAVVETPATNLQGIVEALDATLITIRVQGYSEITQDAVLTLEINEKTQYTVIDTRTPPLPGSGARIEAHSASASNLAVGMTVAVYASVSETQSIAQSITIIQ